MAHGIDNLLLNSSEKNNFSLYVQFCCVCDDCKIKTKKQRESQFGAEERRWGGRGRAAGAQWTGTKEGV